MADGLNDYQMRLDDYVADIANQIATAVNKVQASNPTWKVEVAKITVKGVLKPIQVNNKRFVVIDLNEPRNIAGEFASEIPIYLTQET